MNRKSLVASFGLVACLAVALSAQAPSSNGKVDQKAVQSIRVKVIGCVAGDAEAGRYILTGAFLSGDDVPSTVGNRWRDGNAVAHCRHLQNRIAGMSAMISTSSDRHTGHAMLPREGADTSHRSPQSGQYSVIVVDV
jgi:hypothetical protein